MTHCPRCNGQHDTSRLMTGDTLWCHVTGLYVRVSHTPQGSFLIPCPPPVGAPMMAPTSDKQE